MITGKRTEENKDSSEVLWDCMKSQHLDITTLYNNVSQSHRNEILAIGLICRLKLPNVKDKSYRLCCILEINVQSSDSIRVFDGRDELIVPPSSCIPFSVNYIEGLLGNLYLLVIKLYLYYCNYSAH
jgi:hypothetical protein